MTIVTISVQHNTDRLLGTLAQLDRGTGNAVIQIYSGTRPVTGGGTIGGTNLLLVTVLLAKPSGSIVANKLQLIALPASVAAGGDMILITGVASWARFVNGNGDWSMDTDVSSVGGTGEVQLPGLQLYAGGLCPLASTSAIG